MLYKTTFYIHNTHSKLDNDTDGKRVNDTDRKHLHIKINKVNKISIKIELR